jgi:hypothetical protein
MFEMSFRMLSNEDHLVLLGIRKIGPPPPPPPPHLFSLSPPLNLRFRYFQALARQADATGQDSIDQELDLFQFSSKTPVDRLGHPVVGGITELGLEVSPFLSFPSDLSSVIGLSI